MVAVAVPCILCTLLDVADDSVDVPRIGFKGKTVVVQAQFGAESSVCVGHVSGDALSVVHVAAGVVLADNKIDQEAVVKVLVFNRWCRSLTCCVLFDWNKLHEFALNHVLSVVLHGLYRSICCSTKVLPEAAARFT